MPGNERDALRDLDWSKVYARVPEEVRDGVRVAHLRIRQRELRRQKQRRRLRWAACAAACLALVVGASLLLLNGKGRAPDQVVPLAPEVLALRGGDVVYASRADEFYHVRRDCPRAGERCVALKLVTALEFEKELCPECGANYAVEPRGEDEAR